MTTSEELFRRARATAPGGVHSPVRALKSVNEKPVFFDKGEGAYLYDVAGRRYIDFCQSFGPMILGHRDPDVSRQVEEVFHKIWSLGACEPYSLELAEFMLDRLPWVDKVRFVCSGTEAVMSALRVARAATGCRYVLKFSGCYHGHVDSMLVKAGSGLAGLASSDSAGVSEAVAGETIVAPLDDIQSLENIFAEYGDQIAATIIEPLPANNGLLIQRDEFLQAVISLTRSHQALLIFDEVISGFRVGMQGMAGELGVEPDLVTYGKILGGGFPVGCYAGRGDLMKHVAPDGGVYQAGTLAAQPIAMRAGLATLRKLEEEKVHAKLAERTGRFCQALQEKLARHDVSVIRRSSLWWLHFSGESNVRAPEMITKAQQERFRPVFERALHEGIYLAPSAYEVNFVSSAHDEKLLDEVIEKLAKIFDEVC